MREYLQERVGRTVLTVAENKPNTIVALTRKRVLVETATGDQNYASIPDLQVLADRVFAGEIVEVPGHERSAFNVAVLVTLPGVAYALHPRRVWLEAFAALDAEFAELFPEESASATEGRWRYRTHRLRERSAALVRAKKADVLERTGASHARHATSTMRSATATLVRASSSAITERRCPIPASARAHSMISPSSAQAATGCCTVRSAR